jgi:dienelactone hydrolase
MASAALVGVLGWIICACCDSVTRAETTRAPAERGTVRFEPRGDQHEIPARYRLRAHSFDYEMTPVRELANAGVEVFAVRFPSPVTSGCAENDTVYAEFYRPNGPGPFPGAIVLDITGGDQRLSRTIAACLAQNHVAALFVQMAYYGPRRPAGSKLRMLSTNVPRTMQAIRQTVLDVRRATAWLGARPEIDAQRLGIHGTSLGSMIGALAAEMEPRLVRVSIALGGGGLVDAYYDHPQASPYRKLWEALGGTREQVARLLAPVDPLTYAANLKDRRVIMFAGKRDEIVPPKATEALWRAAGQPKIVWYDCTHYGAALYFAPILRQVVEHFIAGP